MEKWEIEVKEHWNKISDSEWYQSLKLEGHATINDWKCNPMAAIPAWIGFVSQK